MSIVSIETALHHLRADADDTADVQHKLDAAQEIAEQFMGRRIYASYPDVLAAANIALTEMEAVLADRDFINNKAIVSHVKDAALDNNSSRLYNVQMAARGIAINKAIEVAILLILGTLYEHREDVVIGTSIVKLPQAAEHRLQPYRWMGL